MGQSLAANFGPAQVVAIEGPDARRFAAGLFTNDVRTLGVGDTQRQAACDARGRLLGLFDLLSPGPEALLAVLEGQSAEDFVAWFGRYLLMDDAALEVRDTPGAVHLTVQGPGARERLERAGWPTPEGLEQRGDTLVFARNRAGGQGWDIITTEPARLGDTDELRFEAERVAHGDVRWPVDMSDKQMPHELGLRDVLLSFDKGCYIGQETINRIDVRGGVKQRLMGLLLDGPVPSEAPVLDADGKEVGVTRSVAQHPTLGWLGLSVLRMPADQPGVALRVGAVRATVADLPMTELSP